MLITVRYLPLWFPSAGFIRKSVAWKAKLQEFFGGLANPADAVAKLINVGKTLKGEGVEFVGVYGFCWGALRSGELSVDQVLIERLAGGKVTILAGSSDETPFGAAAAVHPA